MLNDELKRRRSRDDDDGDAELDGGVDAFGTGVKDAMHSKEDQSELFGLFSMLGGRQSRNANAMNRNPIPRGRACENVDWLTELFKFLPSSASTVGVVGVRVPMTLVFRHSRPHTWYHSGKRGGVTESATSGDSDEIAARFINASDAGAALVGLEGQVDVVGYYASTTKPAHGSGKPKTRIEYLDEGVSCRRSKPEDAACNAHCACTVFSLGHALGPLHRPLLAH